ncbi:MAG: response regulator [Methanomicrobiales archaeon]|nr:response regulator [Methanomicrobiales archaeon]
MINVLYVDDEPGLLEIGKLYLERTNDIMVQTINSASQGLDQLELMNYDVIVSDFQMPDMDGIQFLKRVRAAKGEVPFILFTGRGREEVVIEAINSGADLYIQKGGEPKAQFAELAHKIRQLVRRTSVEGMLQQNETWFQSIIRHSDEIITLLNHEGVIIYVSPAIQSMLGYKALSMTGKKQLDLVHPDDVAVVGLEFKQAFERDHVRAPVRYRIQKSDGSSMQVESVITHLLDVPGIQGAMMTTRDITAWKEAEQAMQTELSRYHYAELLARSGSFEQKTGASTVTLSEGAKFLFGLPTCECPLSDFENLPLIEYRGPLDQAKRALITDGQPFNHEYKIRKKNSGAVITLHSIAEYDPERKVLFSVVHEVTGAL